MALDVKIFNGGKAKRIGNVSFSGIACDAGIKPMAESYEKADAILVSDSLLNCVNETDFAALFEKPLIYPRVKKGGLSRILNPICAVSYSVSSTGNQNYDTAFAVNSLSFALKRVVDNYALPKRKAKMAAAEISANYNRAQEERKLGDFLKKINASSKVRNTSQDEKDLSFDISACA